MLMGPSHNMNQYWFLISEVLWHSAESNFTEIAQDNSLHDKLNRILKLQLYLSGDNELTHRGLAMP